MTSGSNKSKNIFVLQPKFRTEEILEEVKVCLDNKWTGMGFKTEEFEACWSEYTNIPYSHFLSSNTVGLHLALRILGHYYDWKENDEIITTPLTFVSTNHAILYEKLKPVFADVDESLCISPASFENRITEKTKAIMYVGMGGNTGQLDVIKQICKKRDIRLILDAAHMAGTYVLDRNKEVHVGNEADVTVFSFQAVKNLPTADSGMICFKRKDYLELCKKLSWLGIDKDTYQRSNPDGGYKWKYNVPYLGYKYHGNSIMAAIGLVQLKYLDEDNKIRNSIANFYDDQLKDIDGVRLVSKSAYCSTSSRHLYQIIVDGKVSRDDLMQRFYDNHIYPGVHYIDNTEYEMYSYAKNTCPRAKEYSSKLLSLPLHLNLTQEDIQLVVDILKEEVN